MKSKRLRLGGYVGAKGEKEFIHNNDGEASWKASTWKTEEMER
jgi:hypothetical protein